EAGSRLIGMAEGAGGTLNLAGDGGVGTLTGLGSQFTGFAQYAVLAGANWTLTGTNTIALGAALTDSGTLVTQGMLQGFQLSIDGLGALLAVRDGALVSGGI